MDCARRDLAAAELSSGVHERARHCYAYQFRMYTITLYTHRGIRVKVDHSRPISRLFLTLLNSKHERSLTGHPTKAAKLPLINNNTRRQVCSVWSASLLLLLPSHYQFIKGLNWPEHMLPQWALVHPPPSISCAPVFATGH